VVAQAAQPLENGASRVGSSLAAEDLESPLNRLQSPYVSGVWESVVVTAGSRKGRPGMSCSVPNMHARGFPYGRTSLHLNRKGGVEGRTHRFS
jgi:hypothetical protein